MAPATWLLPVVGVMLVSGTCNTILMKLLCRQTASPGPGMAPIPFDFPFFQTLLMMIGELMCLGAYELSRERKHARAAFPRGIMLLPVCCDWTATTLVNAAYMVLPASTIQMCRGCIVMFTCAFSVGFLGRTQERYHYAGVLLVALGITIVSIEALLYATDASMPMSTTLFGIGLCVAGQIFQAGMLVIEEKFLSNYTVPPLQMVGFEGMFGCLIGIVLMAGLTRTGYESAPQAMWMVEHNPVIMAGAVASMFSIAFFNWSGVTVTSQSSATARATIDVSRTALIWVVELALAWNTFSLLQFCGFVVLVTGTLIYNHILVIKVLEPAAEKQALCP